MEKRLGDAAGGASGIEAGAQEEDGNAEEEIGADAVIRALSAGAREEAPQPQEVTPASKEEQANSETNRRAAATDAKATPTAGASPANAAPAVAATTASDRQLTRSEMVSAIFAALDSGRTGRLRCLETRRFSRLIGWEGDDGEWQEEYETMCDEWECDDSNGFDEATFSNMISDPTDRGLLCSDKQVKGIWMQLAAPTPVPGATSGRRATAPGRDRSRSRSRRDPRRPAAGQGGQHASARAQPGGTSAGG
mmetsp:Transcript_146609/g.281114  ORF Transcript_146609/g.281114 Transcript_146609/m.281114 type:complete len:251 (+) Transcript_146609:2-754(+)